MGAMVATIYANALKLWVCLGWANAIVQFVADCEVNGASKGEI